ncbi:MAG: squalene/phytoene synthase family protein [Paludibacter sp.]|nr:squalene/phytoene synthase family protein [Paludibacter sp.]
MESSLQSGTPIYWKVFHSIDFDKIIDHPNILIAARFWEPERYEAARTCYKFMRAIDDLIDDYKSEHLTIAPEEKENFESKVTDWINTVLRSSKTSEFESELIDTVAKFHIPSCPLEAFAKSMIYDIYNDGFPTLQDYLDYSTGASVAPASIFVHLCGLTNDTGTYIPPAFDVEQVATPCAIFSYLVHIIRDFVKDHTHNLNYFPEDLMAENGLDRKNLLDMAKGGEITDGFRNMIRKLYAVADEYRIKTYDVMKEIMPELEPDSQLSLQIIFDLYLMVFERIDVDKGTFSTKELNPTPKEIRERVRKAIIKFESRQQQKNV